MNIKEYKEQMNNRSFFEKHIKYLPHRTWGRIEHMIIRIQHAWQRVFRGYDNNAYWDLEDYLARIALPVLKSYREAGVKGIPHELSCEQWDAKLDMMIEAFELIVDDDISAQNWEKEHEKIKEGLKEFAEYYQALWS